MSEGGGGEKERGKKEYSFELDVELALELPAKKTYKYVHKKDIT